MYYVYDFEGYYICKTDSFHWAKRIADCNIGYVKQYCPFDGEWIVYDSLEDVFEYFD